MAFRAAMMVTRAGFKALALKQGRESNPELPSSKLSEMLRIRLPPLFQGFNLE